jgi:hypothetical protein
MPTCLQLTFHTKLVLARQCSRKAKLAFLNTFVIINNIAICISNLKFVVKVRKKKKKKKKRIVIFNNSLVASLKKSRIFFFFSLLLFFSSSSYKQLDHLVRLTRRCDTKLARHQHVKRILVGETLFDAGRHVKHQAIHGQCRDRRQQHHRCRQRHHSKRCRFAFKFNYSTGEFETW